RLASDVIAGELLEAEFGALAALPEEVGIQALGEAALFREKLRALRALEGKHHARSLHFRAPAVRALDLERGGRAREHRAHLDLPPLFVQTVQAPMPAKARMRARCSGKLCNVWSPPCRITMRAPSYLRAASRQSSTS